ncbi:MAG: ABC transporter ATP-binding protein [Firmicutes bacterium]|nr:ABC transporter ATP-binding protein [Bacillota bacterium]
MTHLEPAIVLDRVSKTFPGAARPAVSECSLTVGAGELVVLLGSSGSGKTTLLKMINRLYEPTSGTIYVNGQDVRAVSAVELRRRIGYVIQQVGLFPHQTVAQNIATVPRILGWDRKRIEERCDFLLELMQLPPEQFRDRRPRQLSGGQQQRVGIARALAADPPILLMDEPFGALDAITRETLQDELLRIQAQFQKTILFVTHDVDEALKLADRIAVMKDGRIEQVGTAIELLHRPATPFVRQLLGADDWLQRLSVVPVRRAMNAEPEVAAASSAQPLPAEASLRDALEALLRSDLKPVPIVDRRGRRVGVVRWEDVRAAAGDPFGQVVSP